MGNLQSLTNLKIFVHFALIRLQYLYQLFYVQWGYKRTSDSSLLSKKVKNEGVCNRSIFLNDCFHSIIKFLCTNSNTSIFDGSISCLVEPSLGSVISEVWIETVRLWNFVRYSRWSSTGRSGEWQLDCRGDQGDRWTHGTTASHMPLYTRSRLFRML